MGELGRPPVLLDIVEEHFDELDFLCEHREDNVFTPDWDLAHLADHEERCEAHLDGLRLAELHGTDLAAARLGGGTMGAALAATLVLAGADSATAASAEPAFTAPIATALRTADPPIVDGIRRALLQHLPAPLQPILRELSSHEDPLRAASALDVLAFHRTAGLDLGHLLAAPNATARALAFGTAARLGRLQADDVIAGLEHAEPTVRRAALLAAAHLGMPKLADLCRAAATRPTDPDPEALRMLAVLGDPADEAVLRSALARPELARTAVTALGALGRVTAVPLLLELSRDKALGVLAAFAYQRLTGARDVFGSKPWPPPPVAEGEDEVEDLPPSPEQIAADWRHREPQLPKDRSWQFGQELGPSGLPAGFDILPLHARRDVYLRYRARRVAVPDLELEALALRQRR